MPWEKKYQILLSKNLPAGEYTIQWDAEGSPSGIYFYRLEIRSFIETKKFILMR